MANVNVRIDDKIKKEAEDIIREIGLTPSAAINLYYVQIIKTKAIPFFLEAHMPNKETIEAIEEGERIAKDPNRKGYSDIESLKKALGIYDETKD